MCMCVCMYMYMCVYIYIYIYILYNVYIYIMWLYMHSICDVVSLYCVFYLSVYILHVCIYASHAQMHEYVCIHRSLSPAHFFDPTWSTKADAWNPSSWQCHWWQHCHAPCDITGVLSRPAVAGPQVSRSIPCSLSQIHN